MLSSNGKLNEVQLLRLRETFHALPLFHLRTQNFTHARTHVKITRHWKSTLGQLKLLTQYSSFKFTVMEKGEKSGKTLDCEQSLFFFRFSKGSARARECWAAKPRDARNEGGSPRREKRVSFFMPLPSCALSHARGHLRVSGVLLDGPSKETDCS